MADKPWFGVLVGEETGAEFTFHNRGEYLATLYAGGYREKNLDEPAPVPVPEPAPAPRRRGWRDAVTTDDSPAETADHE